MEHDISMFFFLFHYFFNSTEKKYPPSVPNPPQLTLFLVVHGDVAEQVGHGLSVVDAADGLSQNHTDVHRLDLRTL